MWLLLRLPLLLCIVLLATAAPAGAATWLLTVKGPTEGTVQDLLDGKLRQTLSCTRKCTVTTKLTIKPDVARRLGFPGIKAGRKKWVLIGRTGTARPKPRTKTTSRFTLTPEARRRLPQAKNLVVSGEVIAVALAAPLGNMSTAWSVVLK